ncbi:DNA ligase-associated DEXH box helicase, partial [Rhodovulum sulfidophilum]|nr:DNA ligase-associated DEXH box helicase [Rhodovulum sulfidophilum]
LVTHGYTAPFRRWLAERGYDAGIVATAWEGETTEGDAE